MSVALSEACLAALFAQETADMLTWLVVIKWPPNPMVEYRYCDNKENLIIAGYAYTAVGFTVEGPNEGEGELPEVTLTIDNVDRAIVKVVRAFADPPLEVSVGIGFVPADASPPTLEWGWWEFKLREARWNVLVVHGKLTMEHLAQMSCPVKRFTPDKYPNLFWPRAEDREAGGGITLAERGRRMWVEHVRHLQEDREQ